MTPVFGHGRLRLYLLKLLDERPRHGYEIIQQLKERFAGLYAPSAGTVYPRLARMESEGLVQHETTGGRKVYSITDAGRRELEARAAELAELEEEIANSVQGLAEGIRDEVRESARTVREELRQSERDTREAVRGRRSNDPSQWTKEDWKDWSRTEKDHWKDWQQAWKEQWSRQWKEQWRDQLRDQWKESTSPGEWGGPNGEQWRQTFAHFREELTRTFNSAVRDHPVSQEQFTEARDVLERAARELGEIFRRHAR